MTAEPRGVVAGLLLAFCLMAIMTVGLSYLPSAAVLVLAAWTAPADA